MAIEANTPNDWGMRGATNTTLPQFQGVPRQLVVNIEDGYRPVIMDGSTLGGKFKCASTDELATKLGKTEKAASATIADSANSIAGSNVSGTVANATNANHATTADTATTATTATNNILKSGARGFLAGSETVSVLSGNQTITKDSADTIVMNTTGAVKLTFTPAGTNDCAVKVISLTATGETTLNISGAIWANAGEAPTWGTAGRHLILVVHFIGGRVVLCAFDNDEG